MYRDDHAGNIWETSRKMKTNGPIIATWSNNPQQIVENSLRSEGPWASVSIILNRFVDAFLTNDADMNCK